MTPEPLTEGSRRVQIYGFSILEVWQSPVYCNSLENCRASDGTVSSNLTASTKCVIHTSVTISIIMDYQTCQRLWAKTLGWSDSDITAIRSKLPDPKYLDFVSNCLDYAPAENDFRLESYCRIKDPSWPICNTIDDLYQLPQWIVNECRFQHQFDFGIYRETNISLQRWKQFQSGQYPVSELLKYKTLILDIQHLLQDRYVVDFACHAGLTSLMCLHVGAKFVTATNVREPYLKLADRMLNLCPYNDRFNTLLADIHDYDKNQEICSRADVALLFGIIYHVHDHCEVLDSICSSGIPYVLIDTWIPDSIRGLDEPLMAWSKEDTDSCWNGWYQGRTSVFSGSPNVTWLTKYMVLQGYQLVQSTEYYAHGMHEFRAPTIKRDFLIYQNKNK